MKNNIRYVVFIKSFKKTCFLQMIMKEFKYILIFRYSLHLLKFHLVGQLVVTNETFLYCPSIYSFSKFVMSKAHEVTAWIDLNIIDQSWGKSLTKEFDDKKAKYLIESMPVPNTITWLVYRSLKYFYKFSFFFFFCYS